MWHYLRDPTFSHFDTMLECDRHTQTQTDRHTTMAYSAVKIDHIARLSIINSQETSVGR